MQQPIAEVSWRRSRKAKRFPRKRTRLDLRVKILALLMFCSVAIFGCALPNETVDEPSETIGEEVAIGRFVLLVDEADSGEPRIIRMDSTTGETWMLEDDDGPRWVSVGDNLTEVWDYNESGELVRSGTTTPDGRELSELSTAELIRLLTAPGNPPNQ